jgi:glutaredoxin
MSSAKTFVDSAIKKYKVVGKFYFYVHQTLFSGFSKSYCPFCIKAFRALRTFKYRNNSFAWVEIENRDDCSEIQDYLKQLTGGRQVLFDPKL